MEEDDIKDGVNAMVFLYLWHLNDMQIFHAPTAANPTIQPIQRRSL